MMKKQPVLLLCILAICTILAVACNASTTESVTTEPDSTPVGQGDVTESEGGGEETDLDQDSENLEDETAMQQDRTPVLDEVTILAWSPFPAPTPREDNIYLQKIEEDLGVTLDFQFVPRDEYSARLATVLASGDLPDIVIGAPHRWPIMLPAIQQGAFLNLGEQAYLDDLIGYPGLSTIPDYAWENSAVNGDNYGIPQAAQQYHQGSFLRVDWLEALNLQIPETTDELAAVLTAFANEDPDGNGAQDTVGFTITNNRAEWNTFTEPFGVPNGWRVNEDGTLIHADVTDEMRAAIAYMHELYAAGVFNSDFPSLSSSEGYTEFASGISGGFSHNLASGYDLQGAQLRELIPEASLYPITPTVAEGYERVTYARIGFNDSIFINRTYQGQDDVIQDLLTIIDYFFDPATDEFNNFGFVDVHHTVNEDGSLSQTEQGRADIGWIRAWGPRHYRAFVDAPYVTPATREQIIADTNRLVAFAISDPSWGLFPELGLDNPTLTLNEFTTTTFIQMITGEQSMDDWEAYIEEWNSRGGAALTAAMNEIYSER